MLTASAVSGRQRAAVTSGKTQECHDGALIGYARCSTDQPDLTAQRAALTALGLRPWGHALGSQTNAGRARRGCRLPGPTTGCVPGTDKALARPVSCGRSPLVR